MNPPRIGFISLGCPKALVDSERILTQLRSEGYDMVPSYKDADLVVVNTCGFIDAAVEESLDAIGEALAENGKVIVTGCLGAREEEIRARHPQCGPANARRDSGLVALGGSVPVGHVDAQQPQIRHGARLGNPVSVGPALSAQGQSLR